MSINSESIKVASLYIGDLHPEVTEAMLFEKFSLVGPILSIRICRDKVTRKSLNYAYVNFQNYADAEKALETMNFDLVKDKPIRIMWCQKDSSLRKSGIGNIFIKNLDKSIDNKFMYKIFSVFGNILSCKIAIDEKGNSKGYGFVHFEREEMANKAISEINGKLINDQKVYVGKFIFRDQREKYINNNIYTYSNIFIKNFDEAMDDDKLKKLFEKYGNITSAKVMMNENGKSKGFGFVNFKNSENAIKAIEEMNGKEFYGKILFVGRAIKKLNREDEARRKFEQQKLEKIRYSQGLNLLIKNLDDSVDDEYLAKEFLPFGIITSVKVMTDMNGNSRGFGFVCFSSLEEANRAKAEMNGKLLASKPLCITVAPKKASNKAIKTSKYLERIPEIYMQPSFFQI